jgi:CubicO group peptidase (beta-lactamase class C family)
MNPTILQAILDTAVAAGDTAGVAAAITGPEGTVAQATAGATTINGPDAIDEHTLFWIASMTKPVTSVAALQLVERGKLSLDAPIGDLLPELAHPNILENGALRPATQKMTLKHLLTHTAGFSYGFASATYAAYIAEHKIAPNSLASLNMPLLFEPGARWEYGISTDWVGRAVEAASGQTLADYFATHIFAPLGMTDTTFTPNPEQRARRAAIHQRQADGTLAVPPPAPAARPEFFSGGGGLSSTLNDYLKFLRIFLNDGAGIMSPASLAALSTNQISALRAGFIPSANPALSTGSDLNPGRDSKWTLGFLLYPETGPFGRNAGSLSWAGLANTYFWIDPAINRAAIILMQTLPSGDAGSLKTYFAFEKAVYAAPQ